MLKQKSVVVVHFNKANVYAKTPLVNSPTDEIEVVDWEKCFICQKKIIREASKLTQCYIC